MYILDLSMTLTFDAYVGGGILSEFYSQFLSCWILLEQVFYCRRYFLDLIEFIIIA